MKGDGQGEEMRRGAGTPYPLAPLVEEHIRLAGEVSGRPPGYWEDLIASYFEMARWRRKRMMRRVAWLKARREGE
jgi:hypothetical protein